MALRVAGGAIAPAGDSPLRAHNGQPLAGAQRAAPCVLAAGSHPLWVGRGQPLAGWPPTVIPCGSVADNHPCGLAATDRARGWKPLVSYCPCGRRPLQVAGSPLAGRPWLQPATRAGGGWPWPAAHL
ncbi:hypothetical protein GW17_00005438 [Ensete ventricosum]|nr:hypothetical protein GW17_00005438 [Ensete ventricosum]